MLQTVLDQYKYAVTENSRSFEHGKGVPGIFFKYDLEGMSLTIRERTTTLYQFLIRLVGVVGKSVHANPGAPADDIGGVWTVASFGLRVVNRAQKEVGRAVNGRNEEETSSLLPRAGQTGYSKPEPTYYGNGVPQLGGADTTSWMPHAPASVGLYHGNLKSR